MSNGEFDTNLSRMISAELYFLCSMTAAREMYGKGYFALGAGEKQIVDQTVLAQVGGNYNVLTEKYLTDQKALEKTGFQGHSPHPN